MSDDTPKVRKCGTMVVHERLLRTDPAYAEARAASENRAFQVANRLASTSRTGVTVIPVVVHVVFKTPAQNISDAQVKSQIDILNRDFRKTNSDASSTPAVFKPLVADARIEFELASKDANGAATNGITRTQTSADSFTDDNKVKSAATRGANAWDASKYLNIWVCQLGGGLLGYAQFPGGPAATDGVVILHSAFGNTGTAAAPFNLGRSATHEIGHWLNLRHIWGDDGNGCSGDDFVSDTPNAGGPNFNKPTFPHVSCANGPNGDLFMNYMDYVDDAAMFMFTNGQVSRMQTCLDGDRSSIGHTKPAPTLAFSDHPTLASLDTVTLARLDHPTLAVADNPTLAVNDHATLALADHPTLAVADSHPTAAVLDQVTTVAAFDTHVPVPPGGGGDPAPFTGRSASPFVLATPHHTMAWAQSFPDLAQSRAQALATQMAQYEASLQALAEQDASGSLSTVDAIRADELNGEYQRVVDEFQRLAEAS